MWCGAVWRCQRRNGGTSSRFHAGAVRFPNAGWLQIVASTRARNKIRQWFSRERREDAIENGREELARALRRDGLPLHKLLGSSALQQVADGMNLADLDALYASIGENQVSAQSIVQRLTKALRGGGEADEQLPTIALPGTTRPRQGRRTGTGVYVEGLDDVMIHLARCCTPVPGDQIVGFVTRGTGVSVHQADCVNVKSLLAEPDRMIEVEWAPTSSSVFLVQIQVEALDRSGLLSDVTRVLSEHHVNILSATVSTSSDRLALSRFVFEMGDTVHLDRLLNAVRRIDAVYDVYRVSGG